MEDNYKYGEDFEMDELRASKNISKMCKGETKKSTFKELKDNFTAWETP